MGGFRPERKTPQTFRHPTPNPDQETLFPDSSPEQLTLNLFPPSASPTFKYDRRAYWLSVQRELMQRLDAVIQSRQQFPLINGTE